MLETRSIFLLANSLLFMSYLTSAFESVTDHTPATFLISLKSNLELSVVPDKFLETTFLWNATKSCDPLLLKYVPFVATAFRFIETFTTAESIL